MLTHMIPIDFIKEVQSTFSRNRNCLPTYTHTKSIRCLWETLVGGFLGDGWWGPRTQEPLGSMTQSPGYVPKLSITPYS